MLTSAGDEALTLIGLLNVILMLVRLVLVIKGVEQNSTLIIFNSSCAFTLQVLAKLGLAILGAVVVLPQNVKVNAVPSVVNSPSGALMTYVLPGVNVGIAPKFTSVVVTA
jgi:hypothetical protein